MGDREQSCFLSYGCYRCFDDEHNAALFFFDHSNTPAPSRQH